MQHLLADQRFGLLCRGVLRKVEHGEGVASSAGDRWGPDLRRSRLPLCTHPGPIARERIFVGQLDYAPSIPVVAAL